MITPTESRPMWIEFIPLDMGNNEDDEITICSTRDYTDDSCLDSDTDDSKSFIVDLGDFHEIADDDYPSGHANLKRCCRRQANGDADETDSLELTRRRVQPLPPRSVNWGSENQVEGKPTDYFQMEQQDCEIPLGMSLKDALASPKSQRIRNRLFDVTPIPLAIGNRSNSLLGGIDEALTIVSNSCLIYH